MAGPGRGLLAGLALALCVPALLAQSAVVTTPQVRAELVAHAPEGVGPNAPLWLALKIEHRTHWHTYWKNPGDSGLPTSMEWTLPPGWQAGEIAWPTPRKLPLGPLMNYGYEDTLLLAVPVTVATAPGGPTEVRLSAEWLVCKDVCIPEGGDFVLNLPAGPVTAHAALFRDAQEALPRTLPETRATAEVRDGMLQVRVEGLPAAWQGRTIDFFPETPGVLDNATRPQTQWAGGIWQASLPLDAHRSEGPAVLPAVLTTPNEIAGVQVAVNVTTAWPALPGAGAAVAAPALGNATVMPPAPGLDMGLGLALLAALAGGALLNLMPCVFPVLSLKVLGFAAHGQDRRAQLTGGLAYTAGVVLSFVALAGLLLALRAGGEQLGWGFQLQSPWVVAGLAALFTLIGLNLAGLFEFGSMLPSSLASARARHPLADAFLTGVLAVAVASPCTAPFMGASLGLAVTLPAAQALLIFAALGLGMALPYLAAAAWPAVARALPRPGPWMLQFKQLMAFPMFATVVWLVWVLGQQAGIDGVAALLGLLVALAFLAWTLGSMLMSRQARGGFGVAACLLLAATAYWAAPALQTQPAGAAAATDERWQPWSVQRVAQAQAEGQAVFVDFTAAWCVTCQYNKRTTLSDAAVLRDFEARNVLLLRADWTRRDPAISAELSRLGRSGVPVYALYVPGVAQPRVLSEILTVGEVRGALAELPS